MANVSVYNMEGNEVGTMELNDAVFGVEVNEHLVHLAVVAQLANKRQGTQKAKTRSEVSGGGRKPWRQKGTGHARQGSTRAPQWKGGGMVFAPVPRDYTIRLKTKNFKNVMNNLKVSKALVVLADNDQNTVLSARNIPEVKTSMVGTINVYDILKYNTVVATKAAVTSIEEVYA